MATAKAQYIIPYYNSQAGTFVYQGKGRGEECIVGRLPSIYYTSLISVAFKCCSY